MDKMDQKCFNKDCAKYDACPHTMEEGSAYCMGIKNVTNERAKAVANADGKALLRMLTDKLNKH